jgi:O-Antigen ligase
VDDPAVTQKFKALLLCAVGLVVAIFIGWNIGAANYLELILAAVVFGGIFIAFFLGRFFWVLTIASSFLTGAFPILGGQITPFEILMAVGVAKFFVEDVVMRRARFKLGNRFDLFLIAGFMAIITVHAVHDRFGSRFLGSNVWGGRNYVSVYVGLAAYFVIQSIPMQSRVWAKLPYVVLAVTTFDLLIGVITTISPSLIFKIYPFYSAVSVAGIEEALNGQSVTGRVFSFANFGLILILLVLASVSLRQIFNPRNLLRWIGLIAGFVAILFSGYRSMVLSAVIGFLAAGIRDFKYAVVLFLPFLASVLFALSFINSDVVRLPKQMQRGLAFLPGKWDADMARDASASTDFRLETWGIWMHDYFPVHPWLGRGFGFKREWAKPSAYNPKAMDYRAEVEIGDIHNGLFGALDTFGIVGAILFVIWNLRILARAFRVPFQRNDVCGMTLRFLGLYLVVWIGSYWWGALNVGGFLPQELALAAVFFRLPEAMASAPTRSGAVNAKAEQALREELASA